MHPFPCCGSSLVWQKDKPDRKLLCDTTPPKSRRNSLQEDDTMAGCGDHESPSSPRVNAVDSSDSNPPPDPHNNNAGSATGTGTGTGTGTCSVANASTSVCGILHKWVNLGRGWRSRWFVLRDGVLSYYKIHGSHKIFLSPNTERNCRVIGEESLRVIRRSTPVDSSSKQNYRPFGELHLKVSSIRESRSDERRFTIFTGTKHLHLRTDTKEDRTAWIEALKTGKAIFPDMSANEGTASNETVSVSMERLRSRLMQEGLSNVAVKDIEQIMMGEVSTMLNQLKCFKKQNASLLETLRQLETEKFDLENKVVDESQHRKSLMLLRHRNGRYSEGSIGSNTDSDDENERHDAIEEEIEDENAFFDTKEFLSSASFRSDSENALASVDSDEGIEYSNCAEMIEQDMETVGFQYPVINRRSQLPEPKEKEKGTSLWSIIKDNIGKDLTKVCLPVYFNEPISSLQKCFEDLEYSYLLDRAQEWGKRGNSIMRAMNVAAFAVSSYASTEGRHCKPFNPLLGETYEADFPDKGIRFISEKVSHHPMVVACHCSGNGWKFWGDSNLKSKFWGRSIQVDPVGILTLEFDDGEVYTWSKVTTAIYNLILGKIYCEHFGTMVVQGNRGYTCKVKFKEQTIMDRSNPHQVQGVLHDGQGRAVSTIFGKWHESLYCVDGDLTSKSKNHNPLADATLLWKKNKPAENPTRYNLTPFAITLNELTPGLKEKLPPTDSRLRPDQRHLENGEYDMANKEKLRLEQRQRQARSLQEQGWKPQWFHKGEGKDTYEYAGGYWEAREKSTWESCPDVFGQNITDIPVD